jgi:hypothetical protein
MKDEFDNKQLVEEFFYFVSIEKSAQFIFIIHFLILVLIFVFFLFVEDRFIELIHF